MPPHGHGGHHGGGHHGGHGHGHGGSFGPIYSPGVYYDQPTYAFPQVIMPCPDTYDPVRAADGLVYDNECLARTAGATVVGRVQPKKLPPVKMSGLGDIIAGVPDLALFAVGGAIAFLMLRHGR